jgi:hypothetical protein
MNEKRSPALLLYDVLVMRYTPEFSRLSLAREDDPFYCEYSRFEREVHILILGTLQAANSRLADEYEKDKAKITAGLDESTIRNSERLTENLSELHWFLHDQQRFLLNMAVVGLRSRLTHTLQQMARAAESFSPRNKGRYSSDGKDTSAFGRLWVEFRERFNLDVKANPNLIAFIQPLCAVRDQIVHEGGVANPYKFKQDIQEAPFDPERVGTTLDHNKMLNHKFSTAFPEFVDGEGVDAEVAVSQDQLESMVKSSLELVKWCAVQIRAKQLAWAKTDDEANPGRITF